MNTKIVLLVVGLVAGGLIGWITRPQAAEIKLGPLAIEVQSDKAAGSRGGAMTTGQTQHVVVGAIIGFGLGFAADRTRRA